FLCLCVPNPYFVIIVRGCCKVFTIHRPGNCGVATRAKALWLICLSIGDATAQIKEHKDKFCIWRPHGIAISAVYPRRQVPHKLSCMCVIESLFGHNQQSTIGSPYKANLSTCISS